MPLMVTIQPWSLAMMKASFWGLFKTNFYGYFRKLFLFTKFRKSISTRKWHAEHPFAGQNTQHRNFSPKIFLVLKKILVLKLVLKRPQKEAFIQLNVFNLLHFLSNNQVNMK